MVAETIPGAAPRAKRKYSYPAAWRSGGAVGFVPSLRSRALPVHPELAYLYRQSKTPREAVQRLAATRPDAEGEGADSQCRYRRELVAALLEVFGRGGRSTEAEFEKAWAVLDDWERRLMAPLTRTYNRKLREHELSARSPFPEARAIAEKRALLTPLLVAFADRTFFFEKVVPQIDHRFWAFKCRDSRGRRPKACRHPDHHRMLAEILRAWGHGAYQNEEVRFVYDSAAAADPLRFGALLSEADAVPSYREGRPTGIKDRRPRHAKRLHAERRDLQVAIANLLEGTARTVQERGSALAVVARHGLDRRVLDLARRRKMMSSGEAHTISMRLTASRFGVKPETIERSITRSRTK